MGSEDLLMYVLYGNVKLSYIIQQLLFNNLSVFAIFQKRYVHEAANELELRVSALEDFDDVDTSEEEEEDEEHIEKSYDRHRHRRSRSKSVEKR